ncbi:MAG TPA: site-2 protease family protein [Solirubrobacteraceae bacterium]|nr:site-2 protease family protein [Solirubrobacteraceae bacterium]
MERKRSLVFPEIPQPPVGALETPAASPVAGDRDAADPFGSERRPLAKRITGALAVIGAAIAKFAAQFKALLLLLPKLKLLTTSGTMLVSIAAYSLIWGWQFAIGFVILLFIHEMGHVIQLRREGIRASAPMFIPFLGAVISARSLGDNALAEAKVGLAGPILGTVGAAAMIPIYEATGNQLFLALAFIGFFLNLFNLVPLVPLDGGRAMAAMAPAMWFVGLAAMAAAAILFPSPIILLILLFGGMQTWHRWRQRRTGDPEATAYYRVAPRARLAVAAVYIGLIVVLAVGVDATQLVRHLP